MLLLCINFMFTSMSHAKMSEMRKHFETGMSYLQQGSPDIAIHHLKLAVAEGPPIPQVYNALGICYLKKENYEKAVAYFKDSVSLSNSYAEGYHNLATALKQSGGDAVSIEEAFMSAIKADPDFEKAHTALAWFYLEREENLDSAIKHLEESSRLNPQDPRILYGLGLAYFMTGEVSRALKPMMTLRRIGQVGLADQLDSYRQSIDEDKKRKELFREYSNQSNRERY